ncbi:MAG: alpha/beta fold hydrolase [Fimbriimonadaceae bacterium]|nr:alpha/beta fold hydrolase [Fimbriimonadaceae bacterium]
MIWGALIFLASLALLYGATMLLVAVLSVRPPKLPVVLSPGLLGHGSETIELATSDGRKVKAWWVEGGDRLVVACFHGYLMNRAEFVPLVPLFHALGASTILPDLRGHGGSDRGPVTFGVREQAEIRACLAEARRRLPSARIVVFGSSMGAAAACLALADDPDLAEALIADSMYARLSEASEGWWSFFLQGRLAPFMRPANWIGARLTGLRPYAVSTLEGLRALSGKPVLLIFGEDDPLIPPSSRTEMLHAAGDRAVSVTIPQGSHGDGRLREPEMYRAAVQAFLTSLTAEGARMQSDECAPEGRARPASGLPREGA